MRRISKLRSTASTPIYPKALLLPIILCSLFVLSSCSSYGSSFSCRDASGLNCMPLSAVDRQINSGEIVEVELKERAKCKGINCSAKSFVDKPDITSGKIHRIKLRHENDQREREFKDSNILYIK